ncbi:hypothetical protein FACUT_4847 [Fusarium acutatum]|uniref:Uncharacterized protein n=1 Tax=Fusarium acutatum TaxID=78861 RepID=A0A8H4NUD3_9HYPO|nr:hypothetical protein FACUT_4847 [Fusarium acutatum]
MPDASSTPLSLSAAAHEYFVKFLSVRHKEVRQNGKMMICVPSDGEISVLPTFRSFETSLRILYDKYQSLEVIEAGSEEARMSARKRYTDAVAGFELAACSQFFIDGLKPQDHRGPSLEDEASRLKEEFMTDLTTTFKVEFLPHSPPPTKKYLDGDESWALSAWYDLGKLHAFGLLQALAKVGWEKLRRHAALIGCGFEASIGTNSPTTYSAISPALCCNLLSIVTLSPYPNLPVMAELATDLYRPELVDDRGQSGDPIKTSSPTDGAVNGHAVEEVSLSKKEKKKSKKSKKKERLLAMQSPYVNGQETIFAEESLVVEPVTAAEDQEPLIAVPDDIPEASLPDEDPVPAAESAHEPLAESPPPGNINGATETDISPPAPEPQELIYLPFSAQHKLMMYLQERLETMCFSFAQRVLPHALESRGWDCPEMVQLHLWMKEPVFQHYVEQNMPDMERRLQMISFVIEIRRCAVDRKRIDTTVLKALLSSALELAKVLEEQPSVNELEQLRDSVIQTTHRLAEETQVLQTRYETKLQEITAARARLDAMEEKTKAALSRRLEQSRSMANGRIMVLIREAECSNSKVALPGASTTRSCLDWMNDLESSLALGEDDHEDLVG